MVVNGSSVDAAGAVCDVRRAELVDVETGHVVTSDDGDGTDSATGISVQHGVKRGQRHRQGQGQEQEHENGQDEQGRRRAQEHEHGRDEHGQRRPRQTLAQTQSAHDGLA